MITNHKKRGRFHFRLQNVFGILLLLISFPFAPSINAQTAEEILEKVDLNMSAENRVMTSKMTIHGRRNSRTVESKGYSVGIDKSFTEYLSPDREKGTKMLKLDNKLWIYSPDTDRTIQLSGHMLRQSVMGSDLSYEDMMEDRTLLDIYDVTLLGEETLGDRKTYILDLDAKVDDVSYVKQKMWVDQERFVPLKEEYYAKSGQLLKSTELSDVVKIQGRWFPRKILFKDMLKNGKGTEFEIVEIKFNENIPDYIFSKAVLKK